ncbi:MAG: hypothetical protein HY964_01040 [Ignavibacteriales bacterium]|nr:hypothetical protein [Ignavibacteriales bacterium]
MSDSFSMKLGMERCTDCGHRWIDYEAARRKCLMCESTNISDCISLKEIRESINSLRKEGKNYLDRHAKRSVILKQRYREIAELYLQRAQEIYAKINEHFSNGNLSDKVLDQLIIAFRLFSELGIHKSALSVAYMIAMGYAQRGVDKEIKTLEDLNDLVAARQWFIRLSAKEWEAAINLHIGQKAMSTISNDVNLLQKMMQVSIWHFYKGRDYYFENKNSAMVDRIQFDIERTTQLLQSYAQEFSHIEAARLQAQSTVEFGIQVRKGIESLGNSVQFGLSTLGEHIEQCGGSLSRAMQASSQALSHNVANAMYIIAGSSRLRGRSLDKRMSEVGQLIQKSTREVPDEFFQPVKELGAKFALTGGNQTSRDITTEPEVRKLGDSIKPELAKSEEGFKHLDEPTIKLTGTLLDTLVTKGLGKVVEQLQQSEANEKRNK